ncbi:MAG: GHKL domain-containing protein [Candidatus Eisenbacteria bacterium]|uniref:histidine kinase n=1 Tax=Eiseniibacteriota bacterium TaxID=2212470 RepID=A0A538TSS7_UNCEI|nr:MAG: GHKL domain-containing protein [Candidatus Eisenbacteria bacterium]
MTQGLVAFIAIVGAVGGALLALSFHSFWAIGAMYLAAWILVSLLAESLWLPTVTGKAMESMASTVDISLLILLGFKPAIWIVAIAFTLANVFFSHRVWYKAVFNAGQNVITLTAAGLAFTALGGAPLAERGLDALRGHQMLLPWVGATVVYFLMNTLLVSAAVALDSGRPILKTWREEYLYYNSLVGSTALFFLSPLIVVSYLAVGFFGLVFFFVPLFLIKEAGARYIALEKAKDELISSERLAAKGEMAAEIAHELNNYLAAISGRAQLLLMNVGGAIQPDRLKESARIIFEQASNMGVLVKGLLDFSHQGVRLQPTRLNDVVRRTVEFIVPQNKYEQVAFDLDLAGDLPEMNIDPAQIQQVLLNLFSNAADAMRGNDVRERRIAIRTRFKTAGQEVELAVEDTGPGIPATAMTRLFEPSFTTKPEGHGFGLSTCYRIVQNHGGRIAAENMARAGARFTIVLPAKNGA